MHVTLYCLTHFCLINAFLFSLFKLFVTLFCALQIKVIIIVITVLFLNPFVLYILRQDESFSIKGHDRSIDFFIHSFSNPRLHSSLVVSLLIISVKSAASLLHHTANQFSLECNLTLLLHLTRKGCSAGEVNILKRAGRVKPTCALKYSDIFTRRIVQPLDILPPG